MLCWTAKQCPLCIDQSLLLPRPPAPPPPPLHTLATMSEPSLEGGASVAGGDLGSPEKADNGLGDGRGEGAQSAEGVTRCLGSEVNHAGDSEPEEGKNDDGETTMGRLARDIAALKPFARQPVEQEAETNTDPTPADIAALQPFARRLVDVRDGWPPDVEPSSHAMDLSLGVSWREWASRIGHLLLLLTMAGACCSCSARLLLQSADRGSVDICVMSLNASSAFEHPAYANASFGILRSFPQREDWATLGWHMLQSTCAAMAWGLGMLFMSECCKLFSHSRHTHM